MAWSVPHTTTPRADDTAETTPHQARAASAPLRDVIVQIVSHNDYEVSVLKQYLRELQCGAILTEKTASEALASLRDGQVDVMIVRDALPDADAFRILQTLRVKTKRYRVPKVFIVYLIDRRRAAVEVMVQAAPDAILAWPFSFAQFRKRIETTFRKKALS